jgi:hypothetical protein
MQEYPYDQHPELQPHDRRRCAQSVLTIHDPTYVLEQALAQRALHLIFL